MHINTCTQCTAIIYMYILNTFCYVYIMGNCDWCTIVFLAEKIILGIYTYIPLRIHTPSCYIDLPKFIAKPLHFELFLLLLFHSLTMSHQEQCCPVCNSEFRNENALQNHLSKSVECNKVFLSYSNELSLIRRRKSARIQAMQKVDVPSPLPNPPSPSGAVIQMPGSPDEQSNTIEISSIEIANFYSQFPLQHLVPSPDDESLINFEDEINNSIADIDNSTLTDTIFTNAVTADTTPIKIDVDTYHCNALPPMPGYFTSMVRLIERCKMIGVPLYFFDELMNVVSEECTSGRLDVHSIPKYASFMSILRTTFPFTKPVVKRIHIFGSPKQTKKGIFPMSPAIVTYPFTAQLQDLLNDTTIFRTMENISVNSEQRWNGLLIRHKFETPFPNNAVNGEWLNYSESSSEGKLIRESSIYYPLSICMYTDKIGTDHQSRHGLEPVMFSLTLLSESTRNLSRSWRHICFIPTFFKESAATGRSPSSSLTTRHHPVANYHRCLLNAFSGLIQAQQDPPTIRMQLGDEIKVVKPIVRLHFVMGDAKSNDMLCGRIQSRRRTNRLCRGCLVSSLHSDSHLHKCRWIDQSETEMLMLSALGADDPITLQDNCGESSIEEFFRNTNWNMFIRSHIRRYSRPGVGLIKKIKARFKNLLHTRKAISREVLRVLYGCHPVDLAFYHLDMGPNKRGVTGCTPTDCMHAFESGIVEMVLDVILSPLSNSSKKELDCLVMKLFDHNANRCTARENYPRTNFVNGFSSLSNLTADERIARLFTLCIVGDTKEGQAILKDRLHPNFDSRRSARAARTSAILADEELLANEELALNLEEDEDNDDESLHMTLSTVRNQDDVVVPTDVDLRANKKPEEYDGSNAHIELIGEYLYRCGLLYIIPLLNSFSGSRRQRAMESLWRCIRKYKDTNIHPQIQSIIIPESTWSKFISQPVSIHAGENLSEIRNIYTEFRGCADYRTAIKSYQTEEEKQEANSCDYSEALAALECIDSNDQDSEITVESSAENCISSDDTDSLDQSRSIRCASVGSLMSLCHLLLGFHSFYKYWIDFNMSEDTAALRQFDKYHAESCLRRMLRKLKRYIQRSPEKTCGWKISKFHDLLHIFVDMVNFGPATGYDAGTGERGLKKWAKMPARTAQQRSQDIHHVQVARNVHDMQILDRAAQALGIREVEEIEKIVDKKVRRTKKREYGHAELLVPLFWVSLKEEDTTQSYRVNSKNEKHRIQNIQLHQSIVDFLQEECHDKFDANEGIIVYSEIMLEKQRYRAHPNFCSEGKWFDWVGIVYEEEREINGSYVSVVEEFPAKVYGFVKTKDSDEKPLAILHCCDYRTKEEQLAENGLFEHWHLEKDQKRDRRNPKIQWVVPKYRLESVDSITAPLLAIESDSDPYIKRYISDIVPEGESTYNGDFDVIIVKDRKEYWPDVFLDQQRSRRRRCATIQRYKNHLNIE